MTGYTKLFGSIIGSTIWREDDKTRLVFITILALADKRGEVSASIPGLAQFANVEIADCEHALEKLKSPDKYSRTQDYDGRRIEEIDGGWRLLNHAKYRAKMSIDDRREYNAQKQRELRAERRQLGVSNRKQKSALSAHAEAKAKGQRKNPTEAQLRSIAEITRPEALERALKA